MPTATAAPWLRSGRLSDSFGLPALRSSVARTFSGAAQRNSNRGFMRLVDGKNHVYVYIYLPIYMYIDLLLALQGSVAQDLIRRGTTKQ